MRTDHPLRRARIARGLTIEQIVEAGRLPARIALTIDDGRFDELPSGVYARAYVRSFATAVGIDPAAIVDELASLLPPAPDPFPLLRELKGAAPPRRRRNWSLPRWAVAITDAAMLLAINAIFVRLIAYTSDLPVGVLLQHASAAIAIVCAVPMTMYFVLFGGIAGRTPGAIVCRVPGQPAPTPLGLRTILLRALGQASFRLKAEATSHSRGFRL